MYDPRTQEIEARLIDTERRAARLESRMNAADQLAAKAGGGFQGGGGGSSGRKAARATTDIGARSGATPGGGTVQPVKDDGGTLVDDGDAVDVGNLGGLISSGKYCMFWTDDYGSKWVEPEECEETP